MRADSPGFGTVRVRVQPVGSLPFIRRTPCTYIQGRKFDAAGAEVLIGALSARDAATEKTNLNNYDLLGRRESGRFGDQAASYFFFSYWTK